MTQVGPSVLNHESLPKSHTAPPMADLCPRVTSVESVREALQEKGACILEGCETTREAGV